MKKIHLVLPCLFLVLACSETVKIDSAPVTNPVAQSKVPSKNNNNGRIGVQQYYPVGNASWGNYDWTRRGDFNADGIQDVISIAGSSVYMKLFLGETYGFSPLLGTFDDGTWCSSGYVWVGDFDGDHLTDIASLDCTLANIRMKRNYGQGQFYSELWPVDPEFWGSANYIFSGDFNGDGLTDIASFQGTNCHMRLSIPYGNGFTLENWTTDGNFGEGKWVDQVGFTQAFDYNGDGLCDLVSAKTDGTIYVKESTGTNILGTGFISKTFTGVDTHWGNKQFVWAGDMDGNGRGEMITAIGGTIYVKEWNPSTNTWITNNYTTSNIWGNPGYNWVISGYVVSGAGSNMYVH